MTTWLIAGLLLVFAGPATAQQAGGFAVDRFSSGAATVRGGDDFAEAERALAQGESEPAVLAVHAKTLLDGGRIDALREVLGGDRNRSIEGVLQALRARGEDLLVPETLRLAAGTAPGDARPLARENLVALARSHPRLVSVFVEWMREDDRSDAERTALIDVVGDSRDLSAVGPLITQVFGPHAERAEDALQRLTGQAPPDAGASRAERGRFWTAFWEAHGELTRDELLERALVESRARLEQSRRQRDEDVTALRGEVIDARTQLMGSNLDRLVAGLDDPYAQVRLAAARRLGQHENLAQAAEAVPVLLRRLAPAAAGEGEADPAVRAAIVTALGVLGRNRDDVRDALLVELEGRDAAVARAAVEGLSFTRRRPGVVEPLLDYLERASSGVETFDADTAVVVLQTIAENQPAGVLVRLRRWLSADRVPRVRAAAARAVLAEEDALAALDGLADVPLAGEDQLVRYNVALGLGARAHDLPADSPARGRILALLGTLVDDPGPSVRAEAASSLGMTGEVGALAMLERRAALETDGSVLRKIVRAVGELGLPEGVRVIGRICGPRAAQRAGQGNGTLEEEAQVSLTALGGDADASVWLAMGHQLREVAAPGLAAWAYQEVERRFSAAPEFRLVVNEAKGARARVLWDEGRCEDAVRLLRELHAADAPHPPVRDRLEMLASCSERLGDHQAAAAAYLELLALVQEGAAGRLDIQRDAARTLRKAGRFDEARQLLDALLAARPSDNELLWERALIEEGLGDWEAALATLGRLLDRVPAEDSDFRARVTERQEALRARVAPGEGGDEAAAGSTAGAGPSGSDP